MYLLLFGGGGALRAGARIGVVLDPEPTEGDGHSGSLLGAEEEEDTPVGRLVRAGGTGLYIFFWTKKVYHHCVSKIKTHKT